MAIKIGAAFIEVSADTTKADKDVKGFGRNVSGTTAKINIGADTLVASGMISAVARDRFSTIHMKASGLDVIAKSLARMSGARVLGDSLSSVGSSLANLDKSAPKVAAVAGVISNLAAVGLAGASNLLTLGGSLATVAGAGLAVPGILAGAAVAGGVLIAALKDAPTVLADLKTNFTSLQDSISTNFWDQAAAPIRNLTNNLLPQVSGGLNNVASGMGSLFGGFAAQLESSLGGNVLNSMLGNLSAAIGILKGAIAPVVESFTTLGFVGSEYLPRLSEWIVGLSTKFNDFIQGADADGKLRGWIEGGIAGLQTLGDIVGSVASIFGGLFSAASAAGGSTITGLADGLGKIAAIVNGPAFQGALTTVFQGAAAGMEGLSSALGPIGNMFVALAPTISTVLTMFGQLGGAVLGQLASAMSNPAITTGITTAMNGIMTAVQAILPSIPALATAFGTVLGVAGQLLAALGPVLATAITALAPLFTQVAAIVTPLIQQLGPVLTTVITALMPVIAALIPVISSIVTALMPVVATIAEMLVPTINALMPVVTTIFTAISDIITNVMQVVQGVIQVVTGAISGNWDQVWNGMKNILEGVWKTITSVIQGALNVIGSVISTVWNAAVSVVSGAATNIANFIRDGFNNAKTFVSDAFTNIKNAISTGIETAVGFVRDLPGKITGALGNLGNLLTGSGEALMKGFADGISNAIGGVKNIVTGGLDAIRKLFPFSPAKEGPFSGKGYTSFSGKALATDFAKGIASQDKAVKKATSGLMGLASGGLSGGLSVKASGVGGSGLAGSTVAAQSHGTIGTTNNTFYVTIDAKSVDDIQKVTKVFENISQSARQGRGVQNARVY